MLESEVLPCVHPFIQPPQKQTFVVIRATCTLPPLFFFCFCCVYSARVVRLIKIYPNLQVFFLFCLFHVPFFAPSKSQFVEFFLILKKNAGKWFRGTDL